LLLAFLLGIALAVAGQDPESAVSSDDSEDGVMADSPEDEAEEDAMADPVNATATQGCQCTGHGRCQKTEEDTMACMCLPGYHGEDCSEMDDEFDVYWSRVMTKSQSAALKPKVESIFRRLSWMDNRKAAITKRTDDAVSEGKSYVGTYTSAANKVLDAKEKVVEKHRQEVADLTSEVASLRDKLDAEIVQLTKDKRDAIVAHAESLKAKKERNEAAIKKLVATADSGNKVGELSRFHRILEHWELCDINPNHPKCKEPVAKKAPPGVHIVVETKKQDNHYPSKLAADEKQGQKRASH